MTRAYLGLGSNLGDRRGYLRDAIDAIPDVVVVSPLYETDPVGGPEQDSYLNLVVELDTELGPRALLERCQALEAAAGRVRDERWGPRTLDVDILWIDGVRVEEPDLQIPHPRRRERAFVMIPLRDLAPDLATEWTDAVVDGVHRVGSLLEA